ncbi:MAG: ABC transporter permease [Hyphomicrobiales bacterium]|nr:ABC transporter permease [Hyphomicrobiales bacterium]
MTRDEFVEYLLPAAAFALALAFWEAVVRFYDVPSYILPPPSLVVVTLFKDWGVLSASLLVTLSITFEALAAAIVGGVVIALAFAQWRPIERAFFPFAVVMQVTPIVAIAPLLLIYLSAKTAVLVVAFLVAFFPILSNTTLGLSASDRNLRDLFQLYGATGWQELAWLRIPSALPYFLAGVRIGGGLALIGSIVAEIAAGTAGHGAGLAFRIVESGFRLNVARMFAALLLISVSGMTIYLVLSALSHFLLRNWHESARKRET